METLNWPGGRNVRDLGGRQLRGGGTTRHGRVFRSGAPEYLTDDGWAKAKEAGVRTVIDLRNAPAETQRRPEHPAIRSESLEGLVFVNAPTEDPEDTEFLAVCGPYLDHPRAWPDNVRLAHDRIERVFQAIDEADGPVLIHCAGGRDRTGMISAMLLKAAGATEQAIIDDYADGWRGAAAYGGHAWVYDLDQKGWRSQEKTPEDPEPKIDERIPALREWINLPDSIGERFGRLLR
ncbi:tyrosine-protein phosphatase [Actinoplanes sp. TBRC 11911]|uniref:tyrosine-protein phosphatase n=1 Tax=Actinoplanes sp. TBRC 11911 TaxID=2729386 RepID=UPI00145E72EF|nr:tyrosine-protein phosphatase [Actinoplanes sp. TBRC 11911]NMO52995.1 tyrosine-protein phosphatase [Actinoplanes sp. TBRC 11911]